MWKLNEPSIMNDNFDIHPIQWNPIHIRRYWDFFSRRSDYQKNNFAALVGDSLLRIARRHQLPLTGSLLDFGCGCGFFIQKLLKYGGKVTGVEVSEVAADMATASLGEIPGFQGVIIPAHYPLPLPGDHFDGIFLLETIEHFPEEELHTILKELHRLLKKGGYLFITTPNEENLRAGEVICPECGCMFHSGQHLWSWNQ
ncbi:MAG: methyltransferase domain-containing protein, partial [Methanobacteriota archaeon]